MNKLKYIKPTIEVVDIKGSISILAESNPSGNPDFDDDYTGVGSDDNPFPGFEKNNASSIWD
jgi:hypothetical protein